MVSKSDESAATTKKMATAKINYNDKTTSKRKDLSKKTSKIADKTTKDGSKKNSNDSVTKSDKLTAKQSKESASTDSKSPKDNTPSVTNSSARNPSRMYLMMLISFVVAGLVILCFSITLAATAVLKKDLGLDPSVRSLVSECLNSPEATKLSKKRCLYISHHYHQNCTHVMCNQARFIANETLIYTRNDKHISMLKAKEASPCALNRQCTAQGVVALSDKSLLKCTAKSNQSFPALPPQSEWSESCNIEPCLLDSLEDDASNKQILNLLKNLHYGCGTDWPSKVEWCKDKMQKIIPTVQFFECQFAPNRGSKYCPDNGGIQPLVRFSICRYCDQQGNETKSIGTYLANVVCAEGDQLLSERDACSYRCGKRAATFMPPGQPCNVVLHNDQVGYYCFFGQCLQVSKKTVKLGLDCKGK